MATRSKTKAVITHLKLFIDGGSKQVALFKGNNQAEDWQRNCAAAEVLIGNWLELATEELIEINELIDRGYIDKTKFYQDAANPDPLSNWQKHCAHLYSQIAEKAEKEANHEAEADACAAAAELMEELGDQRRQGAWLLRAVEARLKQWNSGETKGEVAYEIADLFATLAMQIWPDEPDTAEKGAANQKFWLQQALEKFAAEAIAAEKAGDLITAVNAAEEVIEIQKELRNLIAN